jgi:phosphoenolpyruvate carboxykinase (ATP)
MKKAIFKLMHYYLPKKGVLTLHSSATVGSKGDHTLIIGLSASGKTNLSMRSNRKVISDD